jgi:murein DD-endopeptidase MepM/ murein hydrolase activator NlpD
VTHHNGVDIKAAYNDPVSAAAAGTVIFSGWNSGFGKCVKIDHKNGYVTLYGHLNSISVSLGQQVKQYQFVGKVGSTGRATGPHLHFTIYHNGKIKNPLEFLW